VAGTLYVVGTPIGNLEDLTFRAVRVLGEVQALYAEDTRAAARILARHDLHTTVISCFEGNEAERAAEVGRRLADGQSLAFASEAGMPVVSDPGRRLVEAAHAAGARVEVVPGPSAPLTALAASGLPSDEFHFVGFLPRRDADRERIVGRLRRQVATLLFFEAPSRVEDTLAFLAAAFGGERRAAVCRELTKLHEEIRRGTLAELRAGAASDPPRGEVTLVVEGAAEAEAEAAAGEAEDVEAAVRRLVAAGHGAKEIAAELALKTGRPRRAIYQLALAVRGARERDGE
jgi:16S rRNA (cytidine1402-2'-O)-methyltransferase